MRRLSLLVALAALCPLDIARADGRSFTISTGYNETALTSGFNRATVVQSQISRGRQLYVGSIDSRGLASIGLGRTTSGQDAYCHSVRYPVLTVFARHGEGPGVALDLLQDWYFRADPSRNPGKFVTLFQTKGGIVCRDGELPRVRVTHRFVSSQRRFPGRSQGLEWVLEFRQDDPATFAYAGERGAMTAISRRSMRQEHWAFFSRELGFGVVRVNVGATHKTEVRPLTDGDPSAGPVRRSAADQIRVPVWMVRVGYDFRRW